MKALKFRSDLRWNLGSFGIISICGLLLNLLMTRYYGFAGLGYFNLLLMFFLVLSQLFSGGIALSVQKLVPQYRTQHLLCRQILTSALLLSSGLAILGCLLLYFLKELPGVLMNNNLLRKGFIYSIAGIGFCVINRTCLSFLNGLRYMRSFAFYSALKVFFMLTTLLLMLLLDTDIRYLGLIFSLPELLLSLLLFVHTRSWLTMLETSRLLQLLRLHFRHGSRALPGYVITGFQSRIDIFILGFFVTDAMLGVYGFALFVADGFLQVFYVFRVLVNPLITRIYFDRSKALLRRFIKTSTRKFYQLFFLLGLLTGLLYPGFLYIFGITAHFEMHLLLFYLLLLGVLIGSGYLPFQFFFNQIGKPHSQTKFFISLFALTTVLLLALVPFLGIFGAPLALLLTNLYQLFYLKTAIGKRLEE